MAWIELHQTLPQNKKTLRLKSILKISQAEAIGHLCMLWLWSVDNAPDGNLSEFYSEEIASISGWDKDPDEFLNALINSGFVDDNKTLHDWYDYAGRLIEKREANRTRMRNARADKNEDCATHVQNTCNARAGATLHYTTQHYRTVPNQINSGGGGEDFENQNEPVENYGDDEISTAYLQKWGKPAFPEVIQKTREMMMSIHTAAKEDTDTITADDMELLNISLDIAVNADNCTLKYLYGIYKKYRERGIKDTESYYDYEIERTEGKRKAK